MKKRGVSPLIASVLLIAFVIILFILISTWIRRSAVEPSMEQAEGKLGSILGCINAKIEIVDACVTGDGNLTINVDNIGDNTLEGVKVKVYGTSSGIGGLTGTTLPFARLSGTTGITGLSSANIERVEVYPVIEGEKVCQGELDSITSVSDC